MSAPSIQPLHQAQNPGSSLHRSMFKKQNPMPIKNKFASPTDDMLSPCSQKLNEHKSKLFTSKANPTKLNFATRQKGEDSDDE
ncbi:LANO_0F16270g1_1 [Lachancea nothofagi CBS 11611]|uniref:LANO_0F16270g1_1 n=1 Tax=Lachancea nothofagi CBS 11611 TaxID=1266666 RepID=A0A1G4KD52_9SACH|nr:LANO_0F16270g1_1 [Lachancea nothofagi CBS 11611]